MKNTQQSFILTAFLAKNLLLYAFQNWDSLETFPLSCFHIV